MNTLLTVAYDGTRYCGWQYQENVVTVQQVLEEAISKLLKRKVSVRGASRTDAGVHALGQRVLFKENFTIPIEKLPYAINSFLPDDVVVNAAESVDDEFHPQYNAVKKTYEYKIFNEEFPNPIIFDYSEFVRAGLNIVDMKDACKYFVGQHDFSSFCAAGATVQSKVREIYELDVFAENSLISIRVTGNGFLYNMVRIISGTLIEVGLGKIKPEEIRKIILSKDRTKAGRTASAKGLTLIKIYY